MDAFNILALLLTIAALLGWLAVSRKGRTPKGAPSLGGSGEKGVSLWRLPRLVYHGFVRRATAKWRILA